MGAACDQGRRWGDAGHPVRIAVNLSAVEFRHPNLPQQIAGALAQARLDPSLLELEITESAYMEREADKPHPGVEEVRRLGVRLAIDDFGTGWSSLATSNGCRSTCSRSKAPSCALGEDPRDEAIIATIVTLARQLDKTVVAEGVETERQLRVLQRLGCQEAQGFLLGRPAAPRRSRSSWQREVRCCRWQWTAQSTGCTLRCLPSRSTPCLPGPSASRAPCAAGGEEIGQAVAERLGYRVIDEIIQRAAEKAGIDPTKVAQTEQRQSLIRRLISSIAFAEPAGAVAPQYYAVYPEAVAVGQTLEERLRGLIREVIEEVARKARP